METKKCYNSVSCVLSVLLIVFMVGAVLFDFCVSKPQMNKAINEINIQIKHINEVISQQNAAHTDYVMTVSDSIK